MTKNQNNALVNATATAPEVKKPKQFIVGTSEKGKAFIDDLCKELQVRGKTGKLIDLPSHAAVDMLIEIATDHRFRTVEITPESEGVDAVTETFDRFEEYALRFESDRNSEKPQTAEELQAELAKIHAKLQALGLKA